MSSAPGASLRRPRASPISPLPLSPNVEVAAWASAVGGDLRRRLLSPQQVEATGTDFVTVSEEVKDPSKHPMRMEQLTQLSATLACPGHLSQRTLRLPWDVSPVPQAHALPVSHVSPVLAHALRCGMCQLPSMHTLCLLQDVYRGPCLTTNALPHFARAPGWAAPHQLPTTPLRSHTDKTEPSGPCLHSFCHVQVFKDPAYLVSSLPTQAKTAWALGWPTGADACATPTAAAAQAPRGGLGVRGKARPSLQPSNKHTSV